MKTSWNCEICGRERMDRDIDVMHADVSGRYGLPADTVTLNIRYCIDTCGDAAVKLASKHDPADRKERP